MSIAKALIGKVGEEDKGKAKWYEFPVWQDEDYQELLGNKGEGFEVLKVESDIFPGALSKEITLNRLQNWTEAIDNSIEDRGEIDTKIILAVLLDEHFYEPDYIFEKLNNEGIIVVPSIRNNGGLGMYLVDEGHFGYIPDDHPLSGYIDYEQIGYDQTKHGDWTIISFQDSCGCYHFYAVEILQ